MDNAATSLPKPREVTEAMMRYVTELGASAGRGAYREAVETGALIHECRQRLRRLFNGEKAEHFVFTLNCSDALNLAIRGLVDPENAGHAVCTHIDHNSILRPLAEMESRGWLKVTRVPVDPSTGLFTFSQEITIVGGTGRFAGASGEASAVGETAIDFSTYHGNINGVIDY